MLRVQLSEAAKRSYPEFEGRIINFSYAGWRGGKIEQVKVVGVDYHIGVTLKHIRTDEHFVCLRGPLAPNRRRWNIAEEIVYNIDFQYTLLSIEFGFYTVYRLSKLYKLGGVKDIRGAYGRSPDASSCSFGQ